MCQLQSFLAVQHQTNPSIIHPALPECGPALGAAPFSSPACQGGWWAWPRGALAPFPGQPQSPSWARFDVARGTGGERGGTGLIFSTAKRKQSCC